MTGREVLDRQMRWAMGPAYAGGLLCSVGFLGFALTGQRGWFALWAPGFPIAFLAMMYTQFGGVRCPWCRGNLAALVLRRGGLSFDPDVRFCPYCGRGLDEELVDAEPDGVREFVDEGPLR